MPYVYEEGVVPVPAKRCTRCGGALEAAATAGDPVGWFEPSTLDEGTWLFVSGRDAPAEGKAEGLRCPACNLAFALYRETGTLKHPG